MNKNTQAGVEQIFNQLIRPRMRSLMVDVYKDITYVIDDELYQAAEYQDMVKKRFVKMWSTLMDGFRVYRISFPSFLFID